MRNTNQLNLLLGAVRASERGKGLDVLMGIALMKSASAKGFTVMDSHLVLENNRPMRAEYEKLGGKVWNKLYEQTLERAAASPLMYGLFALETQNESLIVGAKAQLGVI